MFMVSGKGMNGMVCSQNWWKIDGPTNLGKDSTKHMVSCRLSQCAKLTIWKKHFRWSHPLLAGLVTSPSPRRKCTTMKKHNDPYSNETNYIRGLRRVRLLWATPTVAPEQEAEKASRLTIFHFHGYVKVSSDI